MRVCVTGATGFIGRALIPVLRREGHTVVAWVRSESRARSLLGSEVETVDAASGLGTLTHVVERCDAVVNLAGEPILGGRWTPARRGLLRDSRVQVTRELVEAMAAGLPVVATAVGGIPYIVTDSRAGFLTPCGDTQSFAAAMLRLLEDKDLYTRMSAEARKASTQFDWAPIAEEIIRIYQQIVTE